MPLPTGFTVRHHLLPGDLGKIVSMHGILHGAECGFDSTFEAYVAEPLGAFVRAQSERDRLWIAQRGIHIVGCIAIVGVSAKEAQLRWFLIDPSARGVGLGRHLLVGAIAFARRNGHESVFLWTVRALETAAHLYRSVGFQMVEEHPGTKWGVEVIEEKYVLQLN